MQLGRRFIAAALALAVTPFFPAHAQQAYPSKVIKIVVPTAPGGGNDAMARASFAHSQ